MPITLPPLNAVANDSRRMSRPSRRRFLAHSLSAGAVAVATWKAWPAWGEGRGEGPGDPHRFALFSDVHINADPTIKDKGVNMTDHLRQACAAAMKLDGRPATLIVNGDCAHLGGKAGDYQQFVKLLAPAREAGMTVHLTLGNHDHRERFWQGVPADPTQTREGPANGHGPVEGRQVMIVESPRANWFLLDSLEVTGKTPGILGEAQLAWLASALDARPDKPAIVMTHHHLQAAMPASRPAVPASQPADSYSTSAVTPASPLTSASATPSTIPSATTRLAATKPTGATKPVDQRAKIPGLKDGQALLDLLLPRKQVKLWLFGHTHDWHIDRRDGLHIVNLPPVAYVFVAGNPSGWIDCQLKPGGAALELRCIDLADPRNGQQVVLDWR